MQYRSMHLNGITMNKKLTYLLIFITYFSIFRASAEDYSSFPLAPEVSGGLVVLAGCDSGKELTDLYVNSSYIINGLCGDERTRTKIRSELLKAGAQGAVSVDLLKADTPLPYISNIVNLLIDTGKTNLSHTEIMRVLTPGGKLISRTKTPGAIRIPAHPLWYVSTKTRNAKLDDWPHSLYDATGNAVSNDQVVGPPKGVQWIAAPKWTRFHEAVSGFQCMVSSGGRVYSILDEGPASSIFMPSDWKIVARDAFNGKRLWDHSLTNWVSALRRYKSGPMFVARLLVATPEKLFTTLSLYGPLSVISGADGTIEKTISETKGVEEILHEDGVVYIVCNPKPKDLETLVEPEKGTMGKGLYMMGKGYFGAWAGEKKIIMAIDPEKGSVLWRKETPIAPMTLAVHPKGVFYHNGAGVVCLNKAAGTEKWNAHTGSLALPRVVPLNTTPTLVVHDDAVLINCGTGANNDPKQYYMGSMDNNWKVMLSLVALDTNTGKELWKQGMPAHGYESPKDILIQDDLIWNGDIYCDKNKGIFSGRSVHDGKVHREFEPNWKNYWFHQRCYRTRATSKYLMPSRTGVEFISTETGYTSINHWVRGACLYGNIPANGLFYATPHPCGCFMESMVHGFTALASKEVLASSAYKIPAKARLTKSAQYSKKVKLEREATADEWPAYRHDSARSGFSTSTLASKLKQTWKSPLGTRLTSLTAAGGQLFVSDIDAHTVYALDAHTGKTTWSFVSGGRVDSPPTWWKGRVYFGSRDGRVYCLNASTGSLIWSYLAAPHHLAMMAKERLESKWPIHGSVLINDGTVYGVAGRSMFLDGGIHFFALDALSGTLISTRVMNDQNPDSKKPIQTTLMDCNMPVANPDILTSDGKNIYMKSQIMDFTGKRKDIRPSAVHLKNQYTEEAHLFCGGDFLDDSAFHRVHWIYGRTYQGRASANHFAPRYAPAGKILCFDKNRVYGFGRKQKFNTWTRELEYQIFSANKNKGKKGQKFTNRKPKVIYAWQQNDPALFGRALCITEQDLFIAGVPTFGNEGGEESLAKWQGKAGGIFQRYHKREGKLLDEQKLTSPPVFDGMITAYGKIYIALKDGSVLCLAE
ncbi:MAG: PQQ-binding-like beta-propeller repeat protein [Planctomycetes bacterium]|nr:PQQ-binding-like beta-propeller repeat protein [Planctomycetota bacterium]